MTLLRAAVPSSARMDATVPLRVQAGSRFQRVRNTGANSLFVLSLMVTPLLVAVTVALLLSL